MNRRMLLIVSASSVLALALVITVVGIASGARLNLSSGVFAALMTLFALGAIAGAVAWILGLMQAAKNRRWDWFVEILALGALGALIFAAVGWRDEQGSVSSASSANM